MTIKNFFVDDKNRRLFMMTDYEMYQYQNNMWESND